MTLNFAEIQGTDWQEQLNQNFETIENATLIELASEAETITGEDATKGVTPAGLAAKVAGEGVPGLVELASDEETVTGEDTNKAVTPAGLQYKWDEEAVQVAGDGEALTMLSAAVAVSPANLGYVFNNLDLLSFSGKNGAGACTLTGVKVGDRILSVTGVVAADVGDKGSLFEETITVEDQIQQSSASDLSTKVFLALILRAHVEEQV